MLRLSFGFLASVALAAGCASEPPPAGLTCFPFDYAQNESVCDSDFCVEPTTSVGRDEGTAPGFACVNTRKTGDVGPIVFVYDKNDLHVRLQFAYELYQRG